MSIYFLYIERKNNSITTEGSSKITPFICLWKCGGGGGGGGVGGGVCVCPNSLDALQEVVYNSFYQGQDEVESIFSLKKLMICKLMYKCQRVHCVCTLEWYYKIFFAHIST